MGGGLAGAGRGWTRGQLSLLEVAFPGLLRCGASRTLSCPAFSAGGVGLALGFWRSGMSTSDPRKPAAAPNATQHPEMEERLESRRPKKGVLSTKC